MASLPQDIIVGVSNDMIKDLGLLLATPIIVTTTWLKIGVAFKPQMAEHPHIVGAEKQKAFHSLIVPLHSNNCNFP